MEIYDRAVLYRSVPCKTLPRPRAHTRNCPRLWAASARATETLSQGAWGKFGCLGRPARGCDTKRGRSVRCRSRPFRIGGDGGQKRTIGPHDLLCRFAHGRSAADLSRWPSPLQDAPPPHHQGSSRPPPVPKRMGSGPERIFTRPRAPSSGRSASDA